MFVLGHIFGGFKLCLERGVENIVFRVLPHKTVHFGENFVDHESGRNYAFFFAYLQAFHHLLKFQLHRLKA